MLDKFKDECGVFGIFGHPEAANLTYLGLYALQHRGQESAGIATADGERMRVSRAMGQVADAFTPPTLDSLPGHLAIGHTRYSTAGESLDLTSHRQACRLQISRGRASCKETYDVRDLHRPGYRPTAGQLSG